VIRLTDEELITLLTVIPGGRWTEIRRRVDNLRTFLHPTSRTIMERMDFEADWDARWAKARERS
jgi:hypothetical protein